MKFIADIYWILKRLSFKKMDFLPKRNLQYFNYLNNFQYNAIVRKSQTFSIQGIAASLFKNISPIETKNIFPVHMWMFKDCVRFKFRKIC